MLVEAIAVEEASKSEDFHRRLTLLFAKILVFAVSGGSLGCKIANFTAATRIHLHRPLSTIIIYFYIFLSYYYLVINKEHIAMLYVLSRRTITR